MSSLSRFLPLIGVAAAGVLAMKVITSVGILPDVFHKASAVAAEATAKPGKKAAGEKQAADDPTNVAPAHAQSALPADAMSAASDAAAVAPAVAGAPAPICATSVDQLAREAGMSPNELQVLQNLAQRRQQLDAREAQLNSQGQLVQAADAKLDSRIQQLNALKQQIQALIDQATKTQAEDTNRMIKVYEAMKPKDAAAVMTTLADDVRLPIAAGMKDRALASVLQAMTPDAARDLTEKLANRMKAAGGLQHKLDNVTQAAPANAAQAQNQASAEAASSSAEAPKKASAVGQAKPARPRSRPVKTALKSPGQTPGAAPAQAAAKPATSAPAASGAAGAGAGSGPAGSPAGLSK